MAIEIPSQVTERLAKEQIIWLTTTADGTPLPNPVWFLWDGKQFLVFTEPGSATRGLRAMFFILTLEEPASAQPMIEVTALSSPASAWRPTSSLSSKPSAEGAQPRPFGGPHPPDGGR
jgi:hypothetical protein